MNILFICSKNKWRSPTAETIFKNRQDLHVKSAGTEPSARIKLSSKHILWADIVFVMEQKHKRRMLDNFPTEMEDKQLIVLDIEDDYQYMDEELVEMIKISVEPYL